MSKKQKIVLSMIVCIAAAAIFVTSFIANVNADAVTYQHTSDNINMSSSSLVYNYHDNSESTDKSRTYNISSNWIPNMRIKHDNIPNLGTDVTVFGPYVWLPSGEYTVTFNFTPEGGTAFEYWDAVTNFGSEGTEQQHWDSNSDVAFGSSGSWVRNPHYWRDENDNPHLQYKVTTNGNTADYEFRLFFHNRFDVNLPTSNSDTILGDSALYLFLQSITVESNYSNNVSFDAKGGSLDNSETGSLTTTTFGKKRENVAVPKKTGYTFDGWYAYSVANNSTGDRSKLTFDTNSDMVKIWNADGTPAVETEVSYYDYTVYAKWTKLPDLKLKSWANTEDSGSVSLDWSEGAVSGMLYKGYQSTDGNTWTPISLMDYDKIGQVRVLQVYPTDDSSSQLKTWLETNGFGKGIIKSDSVSIFEFNNTPDSYMKNDDGSWKYDVIFFGAWDTNGGYYDLSDASESVVRSFINSGYGCIFGHDTAGFDSMPHFLSLGRDFLGVSERTKCYSGNANSTDAPAWHETSTVEITKDGLLTMFPWEIGDIGTILSVPGTHNSQSIVGSDIWLRFTLPSYTDNDYADPNNFYLATRNNCAMIQTGHAGGNATADEQKIMANVIFYCYQVSYGTTTIDRTATDNAAPDKPNVTLNNSTASFSASDNGTTYKHKIESYSKYDLTNAANVTNVTTTTVTTGVSGYYYLFDNTQSTSVTTDNGTHTTASSITAYGSNSKKYLHVAAVDGAGNMSQTTTITLPDWVLEASVGDDNNSVNLDWSDGSAGNNRNYKVYNSKNKNSWSVVDTVNSTSMTDTEAVDEANPNKPDVTLNLFSVDFESDDVGTTYYHKVESYDKSDSTTVVDTTNITETEVVSDIYRYQYSINDSETNYGDFNTTMTTSVNFQVSDIGKYFHIRAVDNAGNISEVTTIKLVVNKITYDANGGSGAPDTQYKLPDDKIIISSTQPEREGFTFKNWSTSKTGSAEYKAGDEYSKNADLALFAVWERNSYWLDVNTILNGVVNATGYDGFTFNVDITDPFGQYSLSLDASNVVDYCRRIPYGCTYKIAVNATVGYDIVSEKTFSGTMGASDVTLSPAWKARNDIKYVVNHYTMNLDGTTYSLKETETFNNGTSDTSINLDSYAKSYNGFTYDGATDTAAADDKKPVSYKASAIVARDGSLIVSLYYSRNQYTLTVDYNNGNVAGRASDSYTLYYEQKKQITPPVRSLYKFIGWKLSDTSTSSSIIGSGTIQGDYTSVFTMGYADAKITAKWSVLPVFSDVIDNTSFYEGQDVNVNDIKRIIMASDADKLPPDISEGDIFIDSVTYADNTTDFDANTSGWHLDTGTGKIGDVSVTYSTNDVLPDISDITDVKDDIVKVTHDTTLHIVYNDVPRMQLNSVIYVNSGDKHLNSSSIQSFLKSFILMTDAQDSYDNDPWWSAGNMQWQLNGSVDITGVKNVKVDPAFAIEHVSVASSIESFTTLEQIYDLKSSNLEAFNAITSYQVVFDACDQFGKHVSGKISDSAKEKGVISQMRDVIQSENDRTITVICVNDASYNDLYSQIRSVNTKYVNSVSSQSYWGDLAYGGKILNRILSKKDDSSDYHLYSTSYSQSNNKISITVKDYAD